MISRMVKMVVKYWLNGFVKSVWQHGKVVVCLMIGRRQLLFCCVKETEMRND